MTGFLPTAAQLAAHPTKPILLCCGPAAARGALSLLPGYIIGSWATADYFDDTGAGAPITNGELSPLAGRKVDLWTSPDAHNGRWPHIKVVTELHRLGCTLRLIENEPGERMDPNTAVLIGWTAQQLLEYARGRVRAIAPSDLHAIAPADVPRETLPPLEVYDEAMTHPFEPPTTWEHPEADVWEVPIDLWTQVPVAPMRLSCLPPNLREYAAEISELKGCDPTVIGIGALVTAASVIDDGFRVQPKEFDTTWTESARLWGAIVGDPSTKKSPGLAAVQDPLRILDARLAQSHTEIMRDHAAELEEWKSQRGKDKGPPPQRPASPRVIIDSTTVEALSDILVDNPQGLLIAPDELSGWFGSMDVYGNKGANKDRADWLKLYNGGGQRIDRVTRGNIYVPNWSGCILGGIQPDMFQAVAKRLDNDGLLQRFMVVILGRGQKDQDRTPQQSLLDDYQKTIYQLRDIRPANGREIYRLSPEAQVVRREFMEMIDRAAAASLPRGMAGYLGKWSGLFARLLCTYHLFEHAGRTSPPYIESETAIRVCELMESCLYPHAYQFYGDMLGRSDAEEHIAWIAGHILAIEAAEISTREIAMGYKAMRKMDDSLKRIVFGKLEEFQWIRPHPTARTNKRSNLPTRWDVNPAVHVTFKERAEVERKNKAASCEAISLSAAIARGKANDS